MTQKQWIERCAYRLYELRCQYGIAPNPSHDWEWATSIAKENADRLNAKQWERTDDLVVWHNFDKFLGNLGHWVQQRALNQIVTPTFGL